MPFSRPGRWATTSQWERVFLLILAILLVTIKCAYVHALGVESDESQHLHVVWGWTQGQVQYRDFFDNHTPLFHMLFAPLLGFLGERADIVVPMRIAMLPLFAVSIFCVYWLASRLYSRRVGLWAAVFTGFFPVFVDTTSQFRTDNLWLAAWLSVLTVALTGTLTKWRSFVAGLLLGVAFAVSMKTSLLLVSFLLAAGLVLGCRARREGPGVFLRLAPHCLSALLGLCVVPALLVAYFASKHALPQMYYCVLEHNHVPGLGNWHKQPWRRFIFPIALPFILAGGYWIYRGASDRGTATRRAVVFLTATLFTGLLESFWPLVTNQDFPPVIPLFCIVATPLVFHLCRGLRQLPMPVVSQPFFRVFATMIPLLLAALEIKAAVRGGKLAKDGVQPFCQHLGNMLKLTRPGDYVMDAKGSTIFRKRPFYFALENITQARMGSGSIANTIVQDILRTKTCVVSEERLPTRTTLPWVQQHFVAVAKGVYVAGAWLAPINGECSFDIAVPAVYAIVSPAGPLKTGTLDGAPFTGRAYLAAGRHSYKRREAGVLAAVWSQAVDTGSSPFHWWKEAGKL